MHPATVPTLILLLAYIFFFQPKIEKHRRNKEFDERVLGVIDGLYLSGIPFTCSAGEMRSYVRRNLAGTHKLPDNEQLISYTAASGFRYVSHAGRGDHILFAVLCLVRYADETGNAELLSWCEANLELARKDGINWY